MLSSSVSSLCQTLLATQHKQMYSPVHQLAVPHMRMSFPLSIASADGQAFVLVDLFHKHH